MSNVIALDADNDSVFVVTGDGRVHVWEHGDHEEFELFHFDGIFWGWHQLM